MATSQTHDSLTPYSHGETLPVHAPLDPLPHLIRAVWLQSLRRNETFVLMLLLGVYALGALLLRIVGVQGQAGAHFVSGLGLQLGSLLASLMVIINAARLIPEELELRTIYPVLAKPVSRGQIILGKFLPAWGIGMAALLMFTVATLVIAPHPEYQSYAVLAQAVTIKAGALAILAALALCASLFVPPVLAMLLAGGVAFGGAFAVNVLNQFAGNSPLGRSLAGIIPDFAMLNQFPRYTDGGSALEMPMFLGLLVYAALWSAILLGAATWRFRRMEL